MRKSGLLALCYATVCVSGCATRNESVDLDEAAPSPPNALDAELHDPTGRTLGRALVEQAGDSVRVRVEAVAMGAGAYGAHIHMTGRCEAPDFESAGAHWNPTRVQHGKDNPGGMHKGDLPNLLVGTDGRGSFEYTIPNATISGRGPNLLLDADGAAVVVHARPDDFRTDPSGNSGTRIACGVLR
ncbi:MAG TPA: superoxide dismutase family protein [Allosphingosinicella sp.]|jgi:Cu-Zn family superoxide dismutase